MRNREIKFRAWIFREKEMMEIGILDLDRMVGYDYYNFIDGYAGTEADFRPDDRYNEAILMQYTGLKDKHGKEIFEGDLLKAYPKESNGDHRIYLVSYEAPHFWVENVDKNYPLDVHHLDEITDIEVIGNSYENTEYVTTEPNRTIQMISKANRNP